MTRLILLRHGETEGNVQQVWHGAMDAPLTERGRQQVAAALQCITALHRQQPIDQFYVSPLPRAQRTAEPIAQALGVTMTIHPGLREFDLGDWEGRTFVELRDVENLWGRWREDPAFAPPKGESPRSFHTRILHTLQQLVADHPHQTILVVTHGGVICNALATWLGEGPDDWRRWEPHNCAITILHLTEEQWRPLLVNDTSHLPPTAIVQIDPSVYA
ncbi:MAG: histidine phosphatase family protein [Caldilineaceae bacterium]